MTAQRQDGRPGFKGRLLRSLLKVAALVIALYFLLPYLGLRITRVSRTAVPVSGSELARSRQAPAPPVAPAARPHNMIVFVADGFGFSHLSAARLALHGMGADSVWDRFTAVGWHRPHPAVGVVADSASSATALATGEPTHNDRISVGTEREPLRNLFERGSELGYRGGIVTDSYVWDATPAAFAAHATSRDDAATILEQLARSPLEILVGELEDLGEDGVPEREETLEILGRRFRLFGPDAESTSDFSRRARSGGPVAAIFEEDQVTDLRSIPTLPQLLEVALDRLSSDERPFLLLVESEEADSASHEGSSKRLLRGLEVVERTLEMVVDFAVRHGDTLVVFTSDHETGGLALAVGDSGNSSIKALWPTTNHTATVVPILAVGPGAEQFAGSHATWEVGRLLGEMLADSSAEGSG